jgi:carbamoyltransferase
VDVPFPFEGEVPERRFVGRWGGRPGEWLDRLRRYERDDVCAWLQRGIEREIIAIAGHFLRSTGLRALACAGGVFANVRLNGRLADLPVDDVWIFPHMGDGGLAAGAALLAAGASDPFETAFLGPEPGDAEAAIRAAGLSASRPADPAGAIADLLAAGGIVGRVDGRMALGPRALGDRSILAAAVDPGMTDRLNTRLRRSDFMPFAPIVLADEADRYLEVPPALRRAAGFMTVAVRARRLLADVCPAAVHLDGTARPHIVDPVHHPGLHAILAAYRQRTGIGALINTSFNLHEEPIVCSAADALRCHVAAHLDATAVGPFLVRTPG